MSTSSNPITPRTRLDALSDNALMLRVKAGDVSRMGLLFERYHRPLFRFLYHSLGRADVSEDLVQDVFYRMLKYRHTYTGEGEFRTWMYHVARNVVVDYVKKNRFAEHHRDVTEVADEIGGGVTADGRLHQEQEAAALHRALNRLSSENREVLILSRFQELKYEEIAQMLDTTEGAVKVRVHRALQALKTIFLRIEN